MNIQKLQTPSVVHNYYKFNAWVDQHIISLVQGQEKPQRRRLNIYSTER